MKTHKKETPKFSNPINISVALNLKFVSFFLSKSKNLGVIENFGVISVSIFDNSFCLLYYKNFVLFYAC